MGWSWASQGIRAVNGNTWVHRPSVIANCVYYVQASSRDLWVWWYSGFSPSMRGFFFFFLGGGGGEGRFDESFPACTFFFKQWKSARAHQFQLFRPRSVHNGSSSREDCRQAFADELRVSSVSWLVPTLGLDSNGYTTKSVSWPKQQLQQTENFAPYKNAWKSESKQKVRSPSCKLMGTTLPKNIIDGLWAGKGVLSPVHG